MPSEALTHKSPNNLNTVKGAENELAEVEAAYETDRKARLTEWQRQRKNLRNSIASLSDRDARLAAADTGSDKEEK